MSIILRLVNESMNTHPYKTQIITGGVLWLCGDLLSQNLEKKEGDKIDWKRTAKMGLYGFCVAGPLYAWWYKILDAKTIHLASAGGKYARAKYIGTKLLLDQIVFEVPYLAVFFTISTILMSDGKNKDPITKQVKDKIRNEYLYTYFTDWKVWPPLQILNFTFVPVRYQSVVVNSICVGWNAFLSYVTNRSPPSSLSADDDVISQSSGSSSLGNLNSSVSKMTSQSINNQSLLPYFSKMKSIFDSSPSSSSIFAENSSFLNSRCGNLFLNPVERSSPIFHSSFSLFSVIYRSSFFPQTHFC